MKTKIYNGFLMLNSIKVLKMQKIRGNCLKVNRTTLYKPTLGPNISKQPHQKFFFFLLLIFLATYNLTRHIKYN